jgi:4a-hydroxytetrahydrobiopterin dehydratase
MAAKLSDTEIERRLGDLNDWACQDDTIRKTFRLGSFPAAIAFVTQIGFLAEAAAPHPDIDNRRRRVTRALTTHDSGGLTDKDLDIAAQIDELL